MNLVFFTHPEFLGSHSQSHFARMLAEACQARGHQVSVRQPVARMRRHVPQGPLAKWAGYVDQYLLFPSRVREQLADDPPDTLYVFCDQALGPWVPLVADRPHVVHCHDLLALRSALGLIPENPTRWSGRIYQRYIRHGFRHARHFISISRKSRDDLRRHGGVRPLTSEVVYNGLNRAFRCLDPAHARQILQASGLPADERRCLLHVGGGQWYKNTAGVVRLYAAYVRSMLAEGRAPLPLWMVSPGPSAAVAAALAAVPAGGEVKFFSGLSGDALEALYSHARALLFPSHAEGFGWPIIEALACGCPVVTTAEAPMTEVGGASAVYLPRLRIDDDVEQWAQGAAGVLRKLLDESPAAQTRRAVSGRDWALRFQSDAAIDQYLAIYRQVLSHECPEVSRRVEGLAQEGVT